MHNVPSPKYLDFITYRTIIADKMSRDSNNSALTGFSVQLHVTDKQLLSLYQMTNLYTCQIESIPRQ